MPGTKAVEALERCFLQFHKLVPLLTVSFEEGRTAQEAFKSTELPDPHVGDVFTHAFDTVTIDWTITNWTSDCNFTIEVSVTSQWDLTEMPQGE